jgi:uncharacterized protein (DUF1684 family)
MRMYAGLGSALIVLSLLGGTKSARPTDQEWLKQLQQWRAQHEAALSAPDGWLSLVGLDWLQTGENTIGSSADCQVRLPVAGNEHFGSIVAEPNRLHLKAPFQGFPSDLKVDGHTAVEEDLVVDGPHPTTLTKGALSFFAIKRGDRFALRVKDSQALTRTSFRGLKWYRPDARYRIEASWTPFPSPRHIVMQNVVGTSWGDVVFGEARFNLAGEQIALQGVIEDDKTDSLFFVIRDATSGRSTYPASRFLYTALPDHGLRKPGMILLDFNRLENPPCAFTPYATCPLPPASNRLKISLAAGELKYAH